MDKVQQLLKSLLEKIKSLIKMVIKDNNIKQLEEGNYHICQEGSRAMLKSEEMEDAIYLGKGSNVIFTDIPGLELPIGAFEMNGNNVVIKDPITLKEDGKLYIKGRPLCTNEKLNEEIVNQFRQNGKFNVNIDRNTGEIIKTDAEKYRSEMYDDEARKKTEEVSKEWRENSERTRENEKENRTKNNEENDKSDENAR